VTKLASQIRKVSGPDGAVALDVRSGTMFRINPVGSQILDFIEDGLNPAQMAEQLSATYGAPLDVVSEDVQEFLRRLAACAVIDLAKENS